MNHNQNAGDLPEEVKKAIEAELKVSAFSDHYGPCNHRYWMMRGARIHAAHSQPVHNAGEMEERMREAIDNHVDGEFDQHQRDALIMTGIDEAAQACTAICHDHNAALRARIEQLEGEQMGWQPIETAPKDGTLVDVWLGNAEFPRRVTDVSFREPTEGEYWVNGSSDPDTSQGQFDEKAGWFENSIGTYKLQGDEEPTHWQPLPVAPSQASSPAPDGLKKDGE